jgi:hypothetical protein
LRKERNPSSESRDNLTLDELAYQISNWLLDGEVRQLSKGTLYNRQAVTDRLFWFLQGRGAERCGPAELRAFFAYLNAAHESPDGRWGQPCRNQPVRPSYAHFHYARLKAFCNFLVSEEVLDLSRYHRVTRPSSSYSWTR